MSNSPTESAQASCVRGFSSSDSLRRLGRPIWLIVALLLLATNACSLPHYRRQADREATYVVEQKSTDPRWAQPGFNIEIDPRSRYHDPYDPDRQPQPSDDPVSHQYMHCVNGMKGWPHWDRFGERETLENPGWRDMLVDYVETTDKGEVVLSVESAVDLAYIHSPTYQNQLETLYLSALDVTTERFRLETQFFGGNTTRFDHLGRLRPGGELNLLETENDFQIQRQFATAGELLVGFANSFVWQFAGPNSNSALSILNFNLVQPLLRSAGRDRALERLTRAERGLLGNVRQLARYRKGFYTDIVTGSSGVRSVGRLGGFTGGTGLTGFSGTGIGGLGGVGQATGFGGGFFGGGGAGVGAGGGTGLAGGGAGQVGGLVGLLQQLQEIRNSQYSLDLQVRTLAMLEANLEAGTIDLTQVDQFRQNIETLRAQLLQARAGLEFSLDEYKTDTLGLPPDLPVELDDTFIEPFQLIDPEIVELQDMIVLYQDDLGSLPAVPRPQELAGPLQQARDLLEELTAQFETTDQDLSKLSAAMAERKRTMEPIEQRAFDRGVESLVEDVSKRPQSIARLEAELDLLGQRVDQAIAASETEDSVPDDLLPALVGWTRRLTDEAQSISLIQARARLESVVVEPVELESSLAIDIARTNRLDYMNSRAALVDSWRLIAFNADQLQSGLDVEFSGDIRTVGDNPVEFRAPTGSLTASLEFDAPFTRLLERNNYRQALIDYQESRRALIGFDDGLHQTLRQQLRNLEQLRANLEIQRRAVLISIRRVDFTRAELNRPLPPVEPGTPASTFGPTAVQNLLSALSDLSNAQNNFMSVWLNYYVGRMQLIRDLGLMTVDESGRWMDQPLDEMVAEYVGGSCVVPPSIPEDWWEIVDPAAEKFPPARPLDPSEPALLPPPSGQSSEDTTMLQILE